MVLPTPDTAQPKTETAKDPAQDLADDLADGLSQLAVLVRAYPRIARSLVYSLQQLPGGVHDVVSRGQVLAMAHTLGAETTRRHSGDLGADLEGWTVRFGRRRDIGLLIGTESPATLATTRPRGAERPSRFVPDMDTAR
ncbi:hypothetical protein Psed_5748 [Pseudonocardia dioxanivorans CB1190]|uniref:Uncharacterized protein n=1 Tax=Pseudonocardia dioxanivorans (strain ATCC 55486 / DSM 44775 / JCM 13855 / CB1190) TaxID=675635 RepID=F4D187_PSEUX|nr:hypothetical protein [Pseudonocardia dioxanivorans]AEA27875.1 hypothetical protein Psed_5748 [Pseudonocardia dioxanivorans CB1190]